MTLVGGFNPSEKHELVSWDHHSQKYGKIKAMFQTTNHDTTKCSNFRPAAHKLEHVGTHRHRLFVFSTWRIIPRMQ
jgi:hypothetical protein